jgi:hypothetical protein
MNVVVLDRHGHHHGATTRPGTTYVVREAHDPVGGRSIASQLVALG